MALFGSAADSRFLLGINKELIKKYIDMEVDIYKMSIEDSNINIYGESTQKEYYNPVRVHSLIQRDAKTFTTDQTGYDINRTVKFSFIKDDLVCLNLFLEAGDIILWDTEYYEIDMIHGTQYWGGRNNETLTGNVLNEHSKFGYQVSLIAEAHLSRQTRLQIKDVRVGEMDTPLLKVAPTRRNIYGD